MKIKTLLIGLFIGLEGYFLGTIPGSFLYTAQGAKIIIPVISVLLAYLLTDFLLKRQWSRRKKIIVAIALLVVTAITALAVSASVIYSQTYSN